MRPPPKKKKKNKNPTPSINLSNCKGITGFSKHKKSNSRYLYDANKTPAVPDLLHSPGCSWVTAQAS